METFSKFLENGGKLPEEPPTVSEVPPSLGRGCQLGHRPCRTHGMETGHVHPRLTTTFCRCPRPRRTAQSHRAHLAQPKPGRSCEPCPAAAGIINDPGNDVGSVCVCRVQFSPCWGGTQHRMVPAGPLGDTVQLVGVMMRVEPSGVCRAESVPWAARPQAPMALSIPMEGVLPLPPCDAGPNTAWARCDACPPDPAV